MDKTKSPVVGACIAVTTCMLVAEANTVVVFETQGTQTDVCKEPRLINDEPVCKSMLLYSSGSSQSSGPSAHNQDGHLHDGRIFEYPAKTSWKL